MAYGDREYRVYYLVGSRTVRLPSEHAWGLFETFSSGPERAVRIVHIEKNGYEKVLAERLED
jgi:hypothetical protein